MSFLKTTTIAVMALFLVSTPSFAQWLPEGRPSKLGFSEEGLNALDETMQSFVTDGRVAGLSALVMRKGKIVFRSNYGYANLETQEPIQDDSIFRLGSLSKVIISVAIMQLEEEGHLNLSDPVSMYLPEFTNPGVLSDHGDGSFSTSLTTREITVKHLLNHTAGVAYRFNAPAPFFSEIYGDADISDGFSQTDGTIGDMVKNIADQPLLFEPGSQRQYGLSHDILGRLVEVVSGLKLDEYLEQNIFEPLEMHSSTFYVDPSKQDRLVNAYALDATGLVNMDDKDPVLFPNFIIDAKFSTTTGNTYFSGGAGLHSTIEEYARFVQLLLNKGKLKKNPWCKAKLLNRRTVKKMIKPTAADQPVDESIAIPFGRFGYTFGNGFAIHTDPTLSGNASSPGTVTWLGIFNGTFFMDPETKVVGVMMAQGFPYDSELQVAFERMALASYTGQRKSIDDEDEHHQD